MRSRFQIQIARLNGKVLHTMEVGKSERDGDWMVVECGDATWPVRNSIEDDLDTILEDERSRRRKKPKNQEATP